MDGPDTGRCPVVETTRSRGWHNETWVLSLMLALRVNAGKTQEKRSTESESSLSSITGRFSIWRRSRLLISHPLLPLPFLTSPRKNAVSHRRQLIAVVYAVIIHGLQLSLGDPLLALLLLGQPGEDGARLGLKPVAVIPVADRRNILCLGSVKADANTYNNGDRRHGGTQEHWMAPSSQFDGPL